MPMTIPGTSRLKVDSSGNEALEDGREKEQREIAEGHRGHAGKELEDRLDDFPRAMAGKFAQVDREDGAGGDRHCKSDRGRHQRAGHQRHDAEARLLEHRRPLGVGQKIDERHLPEEQNGIVQQDVDDAGGDEDRQRGGEEQHHLCHTGDQGAAAQECCAGRKPPITRGVRRTTYPLDLLRSFKRLRHRS